MCGIAGLSGGVDPRKIRSMLSAISHRGPDDSGYYINGDKAVGNNRLSIIDLSPLGHQPMFDDEKSMCIVFNGEIYNFSEIKNELQNYYKFRSNSDTEVILYAYKRWGYDCVKKLNGMFAFVIYDIRKNLFFGARDRLGEKPLKYYLGKGVFAFASEIKALLSVIPEKPKIDSDAIDDFLTLQYIPAPKTGFKNIFKLPAAHYFVYSKSIFRKHKYWDLDFSKKLDLSEEEWIERLEGQINESVKSRMIADVSLGSLLSGGVDSSAVVAFMARNSSKRVKTFSLGFSDPGYDESSYSKEVSDIFDTNHTKIEVNSNMFEKILPKISEYYDEPLADNSLIPTILVSGLVRKKMKVALSGDGGDENFAGYDRYNIVALSRFIQTIPKHIRRKFIQTSVESCFKLSPNTFTNRSNIFWQTFDKPFYDKYLYYRSFFNNNDKRLLYSREFLKLVSGNNTFLTYKDEFNPRLQTLDNALKFDIESYLPEDLLYKTDIASMSQGLEVRAPLLDHRLMELAAQIPTNLKIKNFQKKYIFKKMLVEKGILPRNIVNRPKRGFVSPIGKWFKGDLKPYVIDQLTSKQFKSALIFDDLKIEQYLESYFSSNIDYSNNIFALLSLSSWIKTYFK